MRLDGVHHITCITRDGQANVDFYVNVLGLRLVKKTVNFDVPDAYHLYYGDELGDPGSILTFFEYPNAPQGRDGAGMIHQIAWRVRDGAALDYWRARLAGHGFESSRSDGVLEFEDPEGLGLALTEDLGSDVELSAWHPEIPAEHRLLGLQGVRVYTEELAASEELLLKVLSFDRTMDQDFVVDGANRTTLYGFDVAPAEPGVEGAGSVHHIAWACEPEDHESWLAIVRDAGFEVTDVFDRKYFRSIYFREPSGVLFEIATKGPGFTVDESVEELGSALCLPEQEEHRRDELTRNLQPIVDPRSGSSKEKEE